MESTNWAPEHSAGLREHLAQGLSYSEIARAINATFGTTYTRNAALGRAKRMGVGGADRPGGWARLPPRAEQPSLHKVRERYAAKNSTAPTSIRAFCPCWSLKAAIAATPTVATRRVRPSPSAVMSGVRIQATARRIFI
jgi:hypothetical protein